MKKINPSVILIFSHDNKIGDAILLTSLISPIKDAFPKVKIIVMAGRDNNVIWKNHPLIYKTYTLNSRNIFTRVIFSFFVRAFQPGYAIVTSGEHQGKSFSIIRKIIGVQNLIWVGTEPPKFKKLKYDSIFLSDWNSKHYLERCWKAIKKITGSDQKSLPEIYLPKNSKSFSQIYWKLNHNRRLKKIILNTSGSKLDHQWSIPKTIDICFEIISEISNTEIHIISKNNAHHKKLRKAFGLEKRIKIIEYRKNILDIASLIKDANLLISPNTFAIHFGSAFNIRTLAVYVSEKTSISWGSLSTKHINMLCRENIENIENSTLVRNVKMLLSLAP